MTTRILLFLSVVLFLSSCGEGSTGKPAAIGSPGRVHFIMPERMRDSEIGRTLDSLFTVELQVYPREERLFTIQFIRPEDINRSQKIIRNIVFAFTFDDAGQDAARIKNLIEPASLDALRTDTTFVRTRSDVFARGQEIMYLYASNERELLGNIREYGHRLTRHFDERERGRLRKGILGSNANERLAASLADKYGFRIKIPFGYQLADQQQDFVWLRQINPQDDRDVWVARKKFTRAEDLTPAGVIAFRNDMCRKHLFEDPEKPETHLVTEERIADKQVVSRVVNFNGMYGIEVKGLWRTNLPSMGGPFVGYAFVDEASGYYYYAEGFIFAPSKSQRELMREVEVILSTFSTKAAEKAPAGPGSKAG